MVSVSERTELDLDYGSVRSLWHLAGHFITQPGVIGDMALGIFIFCNNEPRVRSAMTRGIFFDPKLNVASGDSTEK